MYAVSGTLFAVSFDAESLTITGTPVPVIVGIRRAIGLPTGTAQLAVSAAGTMAYVPGPALLSLTTRSILMGDGSNEPVSLNIPPGAYAHPRAAPDGTMIAVSRNDGQASDIWTYDLSGRAEIRRLTFGGNNRFPVWSNDSRRVTFQSARGGDRGIFWQLADGTGTVERLTTAAADEEHVPESWSRDGARLLFSVVKGATQALWVFTRDGMKTEAFGQVESGESLSASFSPDGRWVLYAFTERAGGLLSPNRGIFVEPFPATGEKHQVPKVANRLPPRVGGRRQETSSWSRARPARRLPCPSSCGPRWRLARRSNCLVPRGPDFCPLTCAATTCFLTADSSACHHLPGDGPNSMRPEIRVVLNWFEELKRLAPPN